MTTVGPAELRADRVTVRLGGRTVLDGVSVTARRSHPLALTGASGSGKTTLLHVLAGIQIPAEGAVLADGRPLAGQTWTMGLILQNYGLVPFLTAEENVALPLQARAAAADRGRTRDATAEALAAVGLEAVAGQLAADLSGGQRQRTAVARALVIEPAVLLADEPCAALDDRSAEIVLDLLAARAAAGALVVISTHDPEVAARCPDHVDLSPA